MRLKLEQQEKKIEDLFRLVSNVSDEETQALLSKFLCIRTSGLLESSLKNLLAEYLQGSSPKAIQKFVNNRIKTLTNLKTERLSETLGLFDEKWKEEFENTISDEQKAALNSIVSNRNNIAHGENDSISYGTMKAYYNHAVAVIAILKAIIKK